MVENMTEKEMKEIVKKRYSEIAETQSCCSTTSCCGTDYEERSQDIGYSREDLEQIPKEAIRGLGCGNPLGILNLEKGDSVLDLGSGLGIDVFLAAEKVGEEGRAVGIDTTEEMVNKARKIAKKHGYENVRFEHGEMEDMPFPDGSFDAVISNCVINLSPDKSSTYEEIYRILKPGGSMLISDIVSKEELPEEIKDDPEAWSECIGGAIEKEKYLDMIKDAGFEKIDVISQRSYETLEEHNAELLSIEIRAFK